MKLLRGKLADRTSAKTILVVSEVVARTFSTLGQPDLFFFILKCPEKSRSKHLVTEINSSEIRNLFGGYFVVVSNSAFKSDSKGTSSESPLSSEQTGNIKLAIKQIKMA